jgi:uncharacterized protein YkwD
VTNRVLTIAVAAVLMSACGSTPSSPTDEPPDPAGTATTADLQFCLDETNRYRSMRGRPALTLATDLVNRAQASAEADHASGRAHGYFEAHPLNGAENEALRWGLGGTVRGVVANMLAFMWSEGPGGGHYENIIGPYRELGCGFAITGSTMTFVQNLR